MLHELQSTMARALLEGDAAAFEPAIRPGKLTAAKRIGIYRHNVLANLRNALADTFPVVLAIVGNAFFQRAADTFIAAAPSTSGDLNRFGAGFAEFIAAYPHAAELPYLADVARLEWAWHESFHAADHAGLDLSLLGAVPAEEHGRLRFILHPAVRLLASPHPLFRIWEVNQPGYAGPMEVDFAAGRERLLLHREQTAVVLRQLDAAQYAFLDALGDGANLEEAAERAFAEESGFELQGFLLESVQCGVIVNFALETP